MDWFGKRIKTRHATSRYPYRLAFDHISLLENMTDFSMTFTNSSSITFTRKELEYGEDPVFGTTNKTPGGTLEAAVGMEALKWSQSLSSIATGNDGSCKWIAPSGHWFGVKMHQPLQILGIGTAPYYLVAYYDGNETKDYWKPNNPSDAYTFPSSLGFKVLVSPTAEHAKLTLNVNIHNS